jgi:hypothetical protein
MGMSVLNLICLKNAFMWSTIVVVILKEEMMNIRIVVCLSIFVCFMLATSCSPTCDNGGSGADFDPTLYYTKSEVDAKLPVKGFIDETRLSSVDISTGHIDYATGVDLTVPAGAKYLLLAVSTSTAPSISPVIFIGRSIGNRSTNYYPVNFTGEILMFFDISGILPGTPEIKMWIPDSHGGTLLAAPAIWFY